MYFINNYIITFFLKDSKWIRFGFFFFKTFTNTGDTYWQKIYSSPQLEKSLVYRSKLPLVLMEPRKLPLKPT